MPQTIAAWAGSMALKWGASTAVANVVYSATAYLTTATIYAGASYAIGRALAPKLRAGALSSGSPLQMVREPNPPRRVIYGQTRVAGPLLYAELTGTANEYLHLVEALAGHECEEIGDIYFADELVPVAPDGTVSGTFATPLAFIAKHLGTGSQNADANLVASSAGLWTNNHRLRSIAYLYARLKWDSSKYPAGIPNITAVVKGRKVYDPRSSTTVWSDNPALCIRDYLTNTAFGLGVDAATEIDDASFIAAANICDELVALAAGGTEKRYTCHGSFELTAEPATVLEKLCECMAGFVVYVGGKWICHAGAHQSPTIELNEDDLRGPLAVQTKLSLRDTCNSVKGTFHAPAEKWQPVGFIAITNATYLSEDGGTEIWRDLQLDFVTSHSQAQRLAKIELERTRQDIALKAPCKLTALRVKAGDVVMFSNTRFGWTQKQFLVTGLKFTVYDSAGAPALGIDLELRETASAVWDWNSGEETTYDPAPNTTLPDARTAAPPSNLVLASAGYGLLQPDGTTVPRLHVSWTAPPDQSVLAGGLIRIQYKPAASSDWLEWATLLGGQTFDFILDVLTGTAYDVRIRAENNLGAASAWVTPAAGSHTVVGDTTAPDALAAPVASAYPGFNKITWQKSTAADATRYRIYRDADTNPAGASFVDETGELQWLDYTATAGQAYYYFVLPVDASGNPPLGTTTNISPASNQVTTLPALVGAVVPSNPSPAAKPSPAVDGTYLSDAGTAFAYITLEIPALPAAGVWQNLLFRRTGAAEWSIAAQLKNTSTATFRLDGLAPGVEYDVATQAWSAAGASAAIAATGSPFTAPLASASSLPTGGSINAPGSQGVTAIFVGAAQYNQTVIRWTHSTAKDAAYTELKATSDDDDASVNYSWAAPGQANGLVRVPVSAAPVCQLINATGSAGYVRLRTVNRSGKASAWVNLGAIGANFGLVTGTMALQNAGSVAITGGTVAGITDMAVADGGTGASDAANARSNLGLGSLATQASSAVSVTGLTIGAGSAQRKVLARQPIYGTINITGGATSETIDFSLSNFGFSTRPDAGWLHIADWDRILVRYDIDDSTSSNAKLRLTMSDGTNLPNLTDAEITGEFVEYD